MPDRAQHLDVFAHSRGGRRPRHRKAALVVGAHLRAEADDKAAAASAGQIPADLRDRHRRAGKGDRHAGMQFDPPGDGAGDRQRQKRVVLVFGGDDAVITVGLDRARRGGDGAQILLRQCREYPHPGPPRRCGYAGAQPRAPKIAVPTRTWVAPKRIAVSKSALIPMLNDSRPVRRAISRNSAKCGDGSSSSRRHAHQPDDRQVEPVAAVEHKSIGGVGHDARFLRLLAGVDLDQARQPAAGTLHLARQGHREARPVDGFDHVEQGDRLPDLVGLQRSDQVQGEVGKRLAQLRDISPPPPAPGFRRTAGGRRPAPRAPRPAGWVLLTATSATLPGGRPAARAAASTRACTAARLSPTTLSITPSISAPFLAKA